MIPVILTSNASLKDKTHVMFEGANGQLIITPVAGAGLTLRRGKGDYYAYYGTKGADKLTEAQFTELANALGFTVPPYKDKDSSQFDDDCDSSLIDD